MRFEVEGRFKNKVITTDYKRKILSVIKSSMEDRLRGKIYNEDKPRNFTFSPFIIIEKIKEDKIYLKSENIKIFFSVDGMKEGWIFLNSLKKSKGKKIQFGENELEITNVKTNTEKLIEDNIAVFKILSPIVIREQRKEKSDWYHDFDKKGIEILKRNICYQMRYDFPKSELEGIEIQGLKTKRTIVKNYDIKYPVTLGSIMIKASSRILNRLYKRGIGSKTSLGHGMLEFMD
ncbi:CRISPR-associated endoribonuclease Cas6 [Ilyobacter sp.]|uniref:CRISPR-associated endoribonuclease Cas6 n=1 Tax=Ilyobacter sp. TaxID=3100343 RepID=UPI003565A30F